VTLVHYKVALTWNVLYVVPIIGTLTCFATAVSLFLSAMEVRLRDVGMAMPLVLQIWMLTTPVVYPLQSVPPGLRRIYLLNPVAALIESFRRVVLHGNSPDAGSLGAAAAITLFSLVVAYGSFKNFEATMADFI
jgi:lipopolysaccharide transport system permease protein